jgi:hypothetical protein
MELILKRLAPVSGLVCQTLTISSDLDASGRQYESELMSE